MDSEVVGMIEFSITLSTAALAFSMKSEQDIELLFKQVKAQIGQRYGNCHDEYIEATGKACIASFRASRGLS